MNGGSLYAGDDGGLPRSQRWSTCCILDGACSHVPRSPLRRSCWRSSPSRRYQPRPSRRLATATRRPWSSPASTRCATPSSGRPSSVAPCSTQPPEPTAPTWPGTTCSPMSRRAPATRTPASRRRATMPHGSCRSSRATQPRWGTTPRCSGASSTGRRSSTRELTQIGLSIVSGDDGMYMTLVLAHPADASPPNATSGRSDAPPDPTPPAPGAAPPSAPSSAPSDPAIDPWADGVVPVAAAAGSGASLQAAASGAQGATATAALPAVPATAPSSAPPSAAAQAPASSAPPAAPSAAPSAPPVHRVTGYYVRSQGRWWYYPLPPGARPGQVLQPSAVLPGPPPSVDQATPGTALPPPPPAPRYWAPPRRPRHCRVRPALGWSPRRQYGRWYYCR